MYVAYQPESQCVSDVSRDEEERTGRLLLITYQLIVIGRQLTHADVFICRRCLHVSTSAGLVTVYVATWLTHRLYVYYPTINLAPVFVMLRY